MTSVRCPNCGNPIPVSTEKSSGTFQCPSCGLWSSLRPVLPPSVQPPTRPSRPGVITLGLALYITSALFGLLVLFARKDLSDPLLLQTPVFNSGEQAAAGLIFSILCILYCALDIFSVICAFYGYGFGAILQIFLFVPGLLLFFFSLGIELYSAPYNNAGMVLAVISFLVSIASFVCFIVPPAWDYYRECKTYRIAKAFAAIPRE